MPNPASFTASIYAFVNNTLQPVVISPDIDCSPMSGGWLGIENQREGGLHRGDTFAFTYQTSKYHYDQFSITSIKPGGPYDRLGLRTSMDTEYLGLYNVPSRLLPIGKHIRLADIAMFWSIKECTMLLSASELLQEYYSQASDPTAHLDKDAVNLLATTLTRFDWCKTDGHARVGIAPGSSYLQVAAGTDSTVKSVPFFLKDITYC
ncbi:hypothetical protein [Pseudomonas fontis]|uniref:Uncharacterized protein n=1 Tax=Pseudomonas fontis TaxID=2942633 RepID=A0ABT5NPX7_9PSED|nr:hypothetical protein [Pseudomonas fontis]MDD0974736.1 hypothetical protein [Pseudomonas fontis]MDD0990231.1 hypothetical protein [Pseudomonas fontis]